MEEEDVIGLSNVTWPRSRIPAKLLSELQATSQLQSTLSALKTRATQQNDAETIKMIEKLNQILTKDDPADDPTMPNQNQTVNSRIGNGLLRKIHKNHLRQEPFFGSMVTVQQTPPATVQSKNSIKYLDGIREEELFEEKPKNETIAEQVEDYPLWIDIVPHLLLILTMVTYLICGTLVFQLLDPFLASRPFHEVLILPFMTCATIGWGHITPTVNASQMFCILYAIFGVPLCFGVFANLGRAIATVYCAKLPIMKFFKEHGSPEEAPEDQVRLNKLPVSAAMNMVVFHHFVAVLLFNLYLDELEVVQSLYFNYISIAAIGFGDIYPKPRNLFDSIIVIIFISLGVIFLSCFVVAGCLHIEQLFFTDLAAFLTKPNLKFLRKKVSDTNKDETNKF